MRLTFSIDDCRQLIFTSDAIGQLQAYAQHLPNQSEAGGLLLGRYLLDSANLVVDEVTVPQKKDRRKRSSFFRSECHNELAREKWLASSGKVAYLGSWHTHPETTPSPSQVDLCDWEKASVTDTYPGDELFFAIIGTATMCVWVKPKDGQLRKLTQIENTNG